MTEQSFQNFLPVEMEERDACQKLLPVNTLTQRLTFYKTLIFTDEVEFIQRDPPAASAVSTLGIPATFLNPALNRAIPMVAYSKDRVSWADGTFLPSVSGEVLAQRVRPEEVRINKLEEVPQALASLGKGTVHSNATIADRLERTGLAYLRKPDGVGIVELRVEAETFAISNVEALTRTVVLRVGGEEKKISLSSRAAARLRRQLSAMAELDGRPVRLVAIQPRTRQPLPSATSYGTHSTESVPGDITALLEMAPHPAYVSDEWFCHWLRQLEIGASEIEHGSPYFAGQDAQAKLLELLDLYRRSPRVDSCKDSPSAAEDSAPKPPPVSRYQIGLVGTYHQDWKMLGYSRGALLSTIPLAPREELQIQIFTWDRKKVEQEEEFGTEYETNVEINSLARASAQIGHELSETIGTNASVNGGISVPVEAVNVNLGGTAGVSEEVTDSLSSTLESISEDTTKAVEKFKSTHKVKIVETSETGIERRTTRTIANMNSGHTLTLNYFEVLENYEVTTRALHSTQWCVLVDNPDVLTIDIDTVLAYEHILQKALLSPNYKEGFEAARVLMAQRWFEATDVVEKHSAPGVDSDADVSAVQKTGLFATALSLKEILEEFIALDDEVDTHVGGGLSLIGAAVNGLVVHAWPGVDSPLSRSQHVEYEKRITRYCFWKKLDAVQPGFEQRARRYVENTSSLFEDVGNKDEIIRQVSLLVEGFDDDWLHAVKMFAASAIIAVLLTFVTEAAITAFLIPVGAIFLAPFIVPAATALVSPLLVQLAFRHDDGGLPQVIAKAKRQLKAAEATQAVEYAQATMTTGADAEAASTAPVVAAPKVYELRQLAEANANWGKLRLHLEKHRIYYQNEIFRTEDVNERYERLRLMGLASLVDNRLLGFAGKRAILPLRIHALPEDVQEALRERYADVKFGDIQQTTQYASLPTPGIHVKSVVGECDALEPYLQERRQIDRELRRAEKDMALERIEHARQESARLRARLQSDPPLLDNPFVDLTGSLLASTSTDDLVGDI